MDFGVSLFGGVTGFITVAVHAIQATQTKTCACLYPKFMNEFSYNEFLNWAVV